jgi:ribonuclease BN (tRNA processing enzyme)
MNGLTLLGTGTCQLQPDRMASAVLVELDTVRFVYDFGRGITQRLAERNIRQNDLTHIIISHFHPDHLSDIIPYLQAACWSNTDPRSKDLHLYGPEGLKSFISGIISLFGEGALSGNSFTVCIHEISAGTFSVGGFAVSFFHLPPHNNHGIRFIVNGKVCAITGDSSYHQQEISFLCNTDMAIIDAGHISDEEIVALACRSQSKLIVCSHLYREIDGIGLTNRARENGFTGEIIRARDMMTFSL